MKSEEFISPAYFTLSPTGRAGEGLLPKRGEPERGFYPNGASRREALEFWYCKFIKQRIVRNGKYGNELELILLLTENKNYTAQDLADKLGITRRNLYNYLEYLRFSGFDLCKSGIYYRLERSSPFLRKLRDNMTMTSDEATYILHLLDDGDKKDFYAHSIRQKLMRQFNLGDVRTPDILSAINRHTSTLREAVSRKCMCVLHDYSSPHSQTVSDRIVEPFLFMNDGLDIRCHEIRSHTNKTFKLARIGRVELLDVKWIAEKQHKQVFTDLFMFSGEERHTVTLRLDQLSRNLLTEEFPSSADHITPCDGDPHHWLFSADVASFLGIGRFVMGLYRHISVVGDDQFLQYIRTEVEAMKL